MRVARSVCFTATVNNTDTRRRAGGRGPFTAVAVAVAADTKKTEEEEEDDGRFNTVLRFSKSSLHYFASCRSLSRARCVCVSVT